MASVARARSAKTRLGSGECPDRGEERTEQRCGFAGTKGRIVGKCDPECAELVEIPTEVARARGGHLHGKELWPTPWSETHQERIGFLLGCVGLAQLAERDLDQCPLVERLRLPGHRPTPCRQGLDLVPDAHRIPKRAMPVLQVVAGDGQDVQAGVWIAESASQVQQCVRFRAGSAVERFERARLVFFGSFGTGNGDRFGIESGPAPGADAAARDRFHRFEHEREPGPAESALRLDALQTEGDERRPLLHGGAGPVLERDGDCGGEVGDLIRIDGAGFHCLDSLPGGRDGRLDLQRLGFGNGQPAQELFAARDRQARSDRVPCAGRRRSARASRRCATPRPRRARRRRRPMRRGASAIGDRA